MKKITTNAPTTENSSAVATAPKHHAEIENARLRLELADERTKSDALARRCIQLGVDLDAELLEKDNRFEKDMFATVNKNSAKRKAEAIEKKRRLIRRRKDAAAYEAACMRNTSTMGMSAVIGFFSYICIAAGILPMKWGVVIIALCILTLGWSLNTCIRLMRRLEE